MLRFKKSRTSTNVFGVIYVCSPLLLFAGFSSPFCLSSSPLQCWQTPRKGLSGEGEIDQFIPVNEAQKNSINTDSPFLI